MNRFNVINMEINMSKASCAETKEKPYMNYKIII